MRVFNKGLNVLMPRLAYDGHLDPIDCQIGSRVDVQVAVKLSKLVRRPRQLI